MERLTREMTFEEEYIILQKEVKELFDKENRESEPPKSNCVVRRALRCIKKLVAEVEQYKDYKDLEELKAIKSDGFTDDLLNMGFTKGYNKALDDFVKFASDMPTVETEDGTIRPMWLEEMAGQLKNQKKTCFDCKNHFMSDCYLECYKHERINNDSICDDFE